MAELRTGTFGEYYGSLFNQSEPLTSEQQKVNAKYIYSYFTNKGYTINAISALLGNMQAESSINPGRWQNDDVNWTNGGYGLVQWTPTTKYIDWCTSQGFSDPSEMDNNLARIIYEQKNKIQWYATSTYNFSFTTFAVSTKSAGYLAKAFVKNYERPKDQSSSVLNYRAELAENWYTYLQSVNPSQPSEPPTDTGNNTIIDKAVEWAVNIANDDSHGYDQTSRWGDDYDCSSFLIQAYENAGCPVKTNGATYTGNMVKVFKACGFSCYNYTTSLTLVKGDVLWRNGHCEMYIGDGKNVGAHINEKNTTTGGETGDQTGHEISITSSPNGTWTYVLRLPQSTPEIDVPTGSHSPIHHESKLSKVLLFSLLTDTDKF